MCVGSNLSKGQSKDPDKARRYLSLLDTARCDGRWQEVPELARKVEKHAPQRKCSSIRLSIFAKVSPCVSRATSLIQPGLALTARSERQIASISHKPSTTSSTAAASASLSHLIPALLSAIKHEKSSEDAFQAKVCLAWLHWAIGEPGLALSRIPTGLASINERLAEDGTVLSGWTHVCIVKGAYIQG